MALVADLTSDKQRTKAMAVIGISIGMSFALALVIGPVLASWGGLSLVFNTTAGLALVGILIVLFAVPRARSIRPTHGETGTVPRLILRSLLEPGLVRLNIGVFTLHFVLMAMFVAMPLVLEQGMGVHRDNHWQVYLPVLGLSIAGMVPLMILAERKGRLRLAFSLAILLVLLAQWPMSGGWGEIGFYSGLCLFFVGFNYLEATLPSLVSKTVYAGGKGTALGVYSTFQFLGAFAGGTCGGWMLQQFGMQGLFGCSAALLLIWWLLALSMQAPRNLTNLVVRLPGSGTAERDWVAGLGGAAGVVDVLLLAEENTVYLKVDEAEFNHAILEGLDS
jgi:predicted MFS family arabinose efflux permease